MNLLEEYQSALAAAAAEEPLESSEWHRWKAAIYVVTKHPSLEEARELLDKAYLEFCASNGYRWKDYYGHHIQTQH